MAVGTFPRYMTFSTGLDIRWTDEGNAPFTPVYNNMVWHFASYTYTNNYRYFPLGPNYEDPNGKVRVVHEGLNRRVIADGYCDTERGHFIYGVTVTVPGVTFLGDALPDYVFHTLFPCSFNWEAQDGIVNFRAQTENDFPPIPNGEGFYRASFHQSVIGEFTDTPMRYSSYNMVVSRRIVKWHWDFGDGTTRTTTVPITTHEYELPRTSQYPNGTPAVVSVRGEDQYGLLSFSPSITITPGEAVTISATEMPQGVQTKAVDEIGRVRVTRPGYADTTLPNISRPSIAKHRDGRVVMMARDKTTKNFSRYESEDGGTTWQ